jgi:hypothetical protein
MENSSQPAVETATSKAKASLGNIPEKIEILKAAYWRTQRLLELSEVKLAYLEITWMPWKPCLSENSATYRKAFMISRRPY